MRQIDGRALEKVSQSELFEGALEGMLSRLDRYSVHVPLELLADFQESLDGEFGGVGVEILMDPDTGLLTVTSPLPGTPAQKAGVRPGDRILRIDGQSTQGLSIDDARDRMRGKPGDPVTITVLRASEDEPIDIEIIRDVIKVGTVLGDRRNADGTWDYFLDGFDRIGYVRITSFSDQTVNELKEIVGELLNAKMCGLILDLRGNPGGLLEAAIETCDLFIKAGQIVSTRDRDAVARRVYEARSEQTFPDFPMVVLVNQLSASASEIVAACLQDHERAVVVGQRTFGKGTVQEIIPLERQQGLIKLTTASYWRPSGKNIHRRRDAGEDEGWGVEPNDGYEVVVEDEALRKLNQWRMDRDLYKNDQEPQLDDDTYFDPQLARAIEYLEQRLRTNLRKGEE
jgi:carboxyl-terminal processing protease